MSYKDYDEDLIPAIKCDCGRNVTKDEVTIKGKDSLHCKECINCWNIDKELVFDE